MKTWHFPRYGVGGRRECYCNPSLEEYCTEVVEEVTCKKCLQLIHEMIEKKLGM